MQIEQWRQDKLATELDLNLQHRQAQQQLQLNYNNLQSLAENRRPRRCTRISEKRFRKGCQHYGVALAETAMREAQTNYLTTLLRLNLAELELLNARGEIMTLTN